MSHPIPLIVARARTLGRSPGRVALVPALVAAVLLGVPNSPLGPNAASAATTITTDKIDFGRLELGATSETRSVTVTLDGHPGGKPSTSNTAGLAAYDVVCETADEVMSCTVSVSVLVGGLGVQDSFVRLHPPGDLGTTLVHVPITVYGSFTTVNADVHQAGDVQIYSSTPVISITVPLRNYQGTTFSRSWTAGVQAGSYACPTIEGIVTCTMNFQLRPTTLGAQSGFLRIHPANRSEHILAEMRWTMNGVGGFATLDATSIDFGEIEVGDQATETLGVTNTGTRPLTITGMSTLYPRFTVDASTTTCPLNAPIAIGDSCTVGVGFSPTEVRVVTSAVSLSTDAGTYGANLSGTGVADNIALHATTTAGPVAVGDVFTSTFQSTTARGPAIARTISGTIGPDLELVSATRGYLSAPCAVTGPSYRCAIAANAPGSFATIRVRALAAGAHTVVADVTGDPAEVVTTDNRATQTVQVADDTDLADLALTAGVTDTFGDETTAFAVVSRTGVRTTTGIEVSFTVPDGLELLSANRGWFGVPCAADAGDRTVRCAIPDGTTSNFVILRFRALTAGASTVDLSLSADVDGNADNNTESVQIPGAPAS
jgi:hypothetical protein